MAVASAETRSGASRPVARRGPRARARPQPDPAAPDVHRRPPDAGVGVPEAARAGGRRHSCSSRPSRAASGATRSSAIARARCCAGRSATPATRTQLAAARARTRSRRRRSPGLPPFAGGAVGVFAYDLVRTVEPLGRAQPGSARRAGPGADADRRAGRVRPPQAHGHRGRQRLRRRRPRGSLPPARETIAEVRWRLRRPGAAPGARRRPRDRAAAGVRRRT